MLVLLFGGDYEGLRTRSKLRKDLATRNGRKSRNKKTLQMVDILHLMNTFVSNTY